MIYDCLASQTTLGPETPGSARVSRAGAGVPPNTVRISRGFEISGNLAVAPASWSASSPLPLSHAGPTYCLGKLSLPLASSEREIKSGESCLERTIRNHACSQSGRGLPALQDAGAFLKTPNAIRCELHSLSFRYVKQPVLGVPPTRTSGHRLANERISSNYQSTIINYRCPTLETSAVPS